jgi:hypothetical protein
VTENNHSVADVEKIKRWSPVWIIPIVTALIGAWILFYHFSHQGPVVTLVTTTAEGLEAGKTKIKSRSVDVGVVETVTLSEDLSKVVVEARLNTGMEKLLAFPDWVRCFPVPISNCSRATKAKQARATINCWMHRHWPLRTPKGYALCWTAKSPAS